MKLGTWLPHYMRSYRGSYVENSYYIASNLLAPRGGHRKNVGVAARTEIISDVNLIN